MAFPETRHIVLIVIGLIALYILVTYDKKEKYSELQSPPTLTAKYWKPLTTTYWSPFFYNENPWDTVVPKVTLSDSSQYRLPKKKESKKEGFGMAGGMNLTRIVVVLVLAGLLYYLYTTMEESSPAPSAQTGQPLSATSEVTRLADVRPFKPVDVPSQKLISVDASRTQMKGGMPPL